MLAPGPWLQAPKRYHFLTFSKSELRRPAELGVGKVDGKVVRVDQLHVPAGVATHRAQVQAVAGRLSICRLERIQDGGWSLKTLCWCRGGENTQVQ